MKKQLRRDAETIIHRAIAEVKPDYAVEKALKGRTFPGKVYLVAAGKAAWKMADTAARTMGSTLTSGVVVTKYGHVEHEIPGVACDTAMISINSPLSSHLYLSTISLSIIGIMA